jgi:histidyl-tRNA synthetase
MPTYRENLVSYLEEKREELCEDCHRRIETNPIRTLDCKNEKCQTELSDSPKIVQNLCESCDSDFEILKRVLKESGMDFEVDTNLVRGLDYYNKTAFEFVSDEIGSQSAIAGGGRYDKLVEFLGGKDTPAVGFALGIERILDLVKVPEAENSGYYFGTLDSEYLQKLYLLGTQKRGKERVHIELKKRSLNKHLQNADKMGYRFCAILGSDEVANSTIWIKDLKLSSEDTISQDAF